MKKYFLHDGCSQYGPFDLAELQSRQISKTTMVWFDGLDGWKEAGTVDELSSLFTGSPPPFSESTRTTTPPPPPQSMKQTVPHVDLEVKSSKFSGLWKIIRNGSILVAVIFGIIVVIAIVIRVATAGSSPLKVAINPPHPRIVESHANEDPSSKMFAYREGVWATVLNEGGDGRVLIKAYLKQGSNTYERSEEAYLGANQTQEFHFVFTEPKRLGSDMSYEVTAIELE